MVPFSNVLDIFVFANLVPWAWNSKGGVGAKMPGMAKLPAITYLPSWEGIDAVACLGRTLGDSGPEDRVSQPGRVGPPALQHPGLGALGNLEQWPHPFP